MDDNLQHASLNEQIPPLRNLAWRAVSFLLFIVVAMSSASLAYAATYTVINTNDTGEGSFRDAITDSESVASPGLDTIEFDIPEGSCLPAGVCSIALATGLPGLDDGVIIDGTTQPQYGTAPSNVCATATDPSYMRIQITAPQATNVLAITDSVGSTIRGLSLGGQYLIALKSDADHRVECNHLGVNAEGTDGLDASIGVLIEQSGNGVIIGTNGDGVGDIGERNVFGSLWPGGFGVYINSNNDNVVAGNYFGLGADGVTEIGIDRAILIRQSSSNNLIGTNVDGLSDEVERNILGYAGRGLWLHTKLGLGDDNQIIGNWIGVDANGDPAGNTTGIDMSPQGTIDVPLGMYHIQCNRIESNDSGIYVADESAFMSDSDQNSLVDNLIGLDHSGDQALVFESNWWGASDGPSGIGSGSGDSVQENSTGTLDYDPWRTTEVSVCVPEPSQALLSAIAIGVLAFLRSRNWPRSVQAVSLI